MADMERLEQFYPFDEAVLGRVADAAAWQDRFSFAQLADYYNIADGPAVVSGSADHKAFEVLAIKPREDYDATEARVYHLPMSMPVDENMTMRALRLFEADPGRQLILAGNPSAAGQPYGKLRYRDMKRVWEGDLTPIVDPLLAYLARTGITSTQELGFSYGADLAATSSARAEAHGIAVKQGVWAESAAVIDRGPGLAGLLKLALDFTAAGDELDNYVRACNSRPLDEARRLADVGMPRYLLGLAKMSNIAIENSLAHAGFEGRAGTALEVQPDLHTTVVWGTASELAPRPAAAAIADRLRHRFGPERVESLVMQGMHHAGGDDIDLHAAIMLQALMHA